METHRKIVVVGGVAAGASAATKARREDEHARIVLLEKGPYVSFANCGLPFHLSNQIEDRDDLFVVTPQLLNERFDIEVRLFSEATRIDREKKCVHIADHGRNAKYEEPYDKLILAPGAEVIIPDIPGVDAPGVYPLKTIADMDAVKTYIRTNGPETAAVIGGGFIGLEAAEALHALGMEVTVVEAQDQLLSPWDPDIADEIEQHMLDDLWMEVIKSDPVREITTDGDRVTGLVLESDTAVEAELVILAIGVRPNTGLAVDAGLDVTERGLIITDPRMRTSDPDIFAAGDAVRTVHRIHETPCWLPMAGPANRQGRAAGANAAGGDITFPGVIGTAIVRVGKLVTARCGLSEKEASASGTAHIVALATEQSHAGYYPGATELRLKLIVQKPEGTLLGAQAVGEDGVDKRIDVLATAVTARMNVRELVDLELTYAPPFGSAKDPVNVAAMIAVNILDGRSDTISWTELYESTGPALILDVRSEAERKTVYVKETTHIDIDALRAQVSTFDRDAPIRIYCRIGKRGYFAEQLLRGMGFKDVKNIAGGWRSIWGELREDKLVGGEPRFND